MKVICQVLLAVSWMGLALASGRLTPDQLRKLPKNAGPSSRVIGGEVAAVKQFPYMMSMWNDFGRHCGGALLSKDYAITVAHCIDGIFYLLAYFGTINIKERDENMVEWVLHRDSCLIHPEWNAEKRWNDVALIEFPEPVELSTYVVPIALPSYQDQENDYFGEYVTVTGWGYTSEGATDVTPLLHYAQLEIISIKKCRSHYPNTVRDSNLCTKTKTGKGICHGDSGDPIVYTQSDGNKILVGLGSLVSSEGCVSSGVPNVFTRIDSYLDWIGDVQCCQLKIRRVSRFPTEK